MKALFYGTQKLVSNPQEMKGYVLFVPIRISTMLVTVLLFATHFNAILGNYNLIRIKFALILIVKNVTPK